MDQQENTPNEQLSAALTDDTSTQKEKKDRLKEDISGGWTNMTLFNSYLGGALKHDVYKPRGKGSDVWARGINAIYKADNTIVPDWYICKRMNAEMNDCNQLFNLKLRQGNSRLREHCDKHDQEGKQEKLFQVSYEQMISALDKANLVGDSYGIVSFRAHLPRPELMKIW